MAILVRSVICALGLASSIAMVHASESSSESFGALKNKLNASFNQDKTVVLDEFAASKKAYKQSFDKAKEKLGLIWDKPELSNKTTWVQYSKNDAVKRTVNFESGEVVVEVISSDQSSDDVKKVVDEQIQELKNETTLQAYSKDKVLSEMKAKPSKLESNQKVIPEVDSDKLQKTAKTSEYTQSNGTKVTRVTMSLPSNKIAQRALIYLEDVNKMAAKWDVQPELILAIIHTESHFNPMAQSHIPAYGLMQVVPTSAGKDVTKLLLGKERLLTADILFDPKYNINIGTAYLNVLFTRYLTNVKDQDIKTYLAISSYNGGVGAVAKHISGKGSLSALAKKANTLDPDTVYKSLSTTFPYKETRNYLKKVNNKKIYYSKLLKTSKI
ncbi:transglycosylase SLT domain-containing protein [Vibrio cortegadensis]|uniref:transglycosylase SLT domain-containing protein n=1 Tax=Vibrio cortegadensis TaxID=1328770 RepID=UPI0021C25FF0|nr:transglycosylase SLT domain-containing protein [Vibrio cortegadensis]MDN3697328.1 transglycosylase SLT domain-containing protein [Vibrio cortegadensis]